MDAPPINDVVTVFNVAYETAYTRAEQVGALTYDVTSCTFISKEKGTCKATMDVPSDIGLVRSDYTMNVRILPGGITVTAGPDYWRKISKEAAAKRMIGPPVSKGQLAPQSQQR